MCIRDSDDAVARRGDSPTGHDPSMIPPVMTHHARGTRPIHPAAAARSRSSTPRVARRETRDARAKMDCEFWGAVIPAGKSIRVDVVADEEYIHVSQVALGANARNGRTTLKLAVADDAEVNGGRGGEKPQTLCTLTRDACDQMGLDVVVDATFTLAAEGANDVHVSGWLSLIHI